MVDHKVKLKHFDKGNMQSVVLYSNILIVILNYFMHVLSRYGSVFFVDTHVLELLISQLFPQLSLDASILIRMRKEILKMYANDDCSIEKLIINEFE